MPPPSPIPPNPVPPPDPSTLTVDNLVYETSTVGMIEDWGGDSLIRPKSGSWLGFSEVTTDKADMIMTTAGRSYRYNSLRDVSVDPLHQDADVMSINSVVTGTDLIRMPNNLLTVHYFVDREKVRETEANIFHFEATMDLNDSWFKAWIPFQVVSIVLRVQVDVPSVMSLSNSLLTATSDFSNCLDHVSVATLFTRNTASRFLQCIVVSGITRVITTGASAFKYQFKTIFPDESLAPGSIRVTRNYNLYFNSSYASNDTKLSLPTALVPFDFELV